MSDMFKYKNYEGTIQYSVPDKCLYGKIAYIRDLVSYEGQSVEELEAAFKESVDDYLETCEEVGKEPNKPFKGSFNVRPGSTLHRKAALYAEKHDMNLNGVVKAALENYLQGERV